jgi:hypothetical protein
MIKPGDYFKIFLAITLAGLFLFGAAGWEKKEAYAQESDAVAVRVLPNPSHLGPLDWYLEQGFKGSPVKLSVDGYDAIRDGRTVYVNVANIDDSGKFYTNIYLISYNQGAKPETIAIFNNLLNKWKFNTNLVDIGACSDPAGSNKIYNANYDFEASAAGWSPRSGVTLSQSSEQAISGNFSLKALCTNLKAIDHHQFEFGMNMGAILQDDKKENFVATAWVYLPTDGGLDQVYLQYRDGGSNFYTDGTAYNSAIIRAKDRWQKIVLPFKAKATSGNGFLYFWASSGDLGKYMYVDNVVVRAAGPSCLVDADCPGGSFCPSLKAEITRDVKRLADINNLKSSIVSYQKRTGHYPLLGSGTYLKGKTISTWPSWNAEFASELGVAAPSDPINKLGDCGGGQYDPVTCWDDKTKTFADPTPGDGVFNLPASSRAYVYTADDKGQNYTACAEMESGYLQGYEEGACLGSFTNNQPPVIDCGNLIGIAGQPFTGYVKVRDPENDLIAINIYDLDNTPFTVSDTGNPNEKKIFSAAPAAGSYSFAARAVDSRNAESSAACNISISSSAFFVYPVNSLRVLVGKAANFSVFAYNSKQDYGGISFSFSDSKFKCKNISVTPDGRAKCDVSYESDETRVYSLVVSAAIGGVKTADQNFSLEVYNNPPVIQKIDCPKIAKLGQQYSCIVKAADPDGHNIKFDHSTVNVPGLAFTSDGKSLATLSGVPNAIGSYTISFVANDDPYGAQSEPAPFTLQVVNFCGDGKKDSPNFEGKGGPSGDGYENCDCGNMSYADCSAKSKDTNVPGPGESRIDWQYGCSNVCSNLGGGFCGDGTAQDGKYNSFKSMLGKQSLPGGLDIIHGKIDYGEQCDFGGDINCCGKCQWVVGGPTEEKSVSETVTVSSNATSLLTLPPEILNSRGVAGGSFKASAVDANGKDPSMQAIVFATDASNLGYFQKPDGTFDMSGLQAAVKAGMKKFYDISNENNTNVYVGSLTFGACAGQSTVPVCDIYNPVNFRNLTAINEGEANFSDESLTVTNYLFHGDYAGNSGADQALVRAAAMLNDVNSPWHNASQKYIIILSDGVNYDGDEANAIKGSGIQVYTINFPFGNFAQNMCKWSSDYNQNGVLVPGHSCNPAVPTSKDFSYINQDRNDPAGTTLLIYNSISQSILANMIRGASFRIGGTGAPSGGASGSLDLSGINNFVLPTDGSSISCDVSGAPPCTTKINNPANPGSLNVWASWINGTGQAVSGNIKILFSDFKFNIVSPCETQ